MRSRVMPGSLVTMERREPVKRLKSVDLPTLGRPTITSDGRACVMGRGRGCTARNRGTCAIFHCTAWTRLLKGSGKVVMTGWSEPLWARGSGRFVFRRERVEGDYSSDRRGRLARPQFLSTAWGDC